MTSIKDIIKENLKTKIELNRVNSRIIKNKAVDMDYLRTKRDFLWETIQENKKRINILKKQGE